MEGGYGTNGGVAGPFARSYLDTVRGHTISKIVSRRTFLTFGVFEEDGRRGESHF